jgi:hypothetical protein
MIWQVKTRQIIFITSTQAAERANVSSSITREHTRNAKKKRLRYIKTNGTVWKIVDTPDDKAKTKYVAAPPTVED